MGNLSMMCTPLGQATIMFLVASHLASAPLSAQARRATRPTPAESALAARIAGCYELADNGWRSDPELVKLANVARITIPSSPVRFELTTHPAPGWSTVGDSADVYFFEVLTDSIAGWRGGLFTSWIRVAGAEPTILISQPLPMAGFYLRVTLRATDLAGTITAFTDAIPPDGKAEASHAVTARRVVCPAHRLGRVHLLSVVASLDSTSRR